MGICDLACVIPKERVSGVIGRKAYTQDERDQEENDTPYLLLVGFLGPFWFGFSLRFLAQ